MMPLTILHLHRMGDPSRYRESVYALEHMIPAQAPESICFVHDADLPLPRYVRDLHFDLIVLGPTFLCARYDQGLLARFKEEYAFIAQSDACKIALPQDDYDCSALLDDWMVEWSMDFVYTVCPTGWDLLYPRYIQSGVIRLGFTGYISQTWIDQWKHPRDHSTRPFDVVYRASRLPANFGSLGQLKSEIVHSFERASKGYGLALDLSTSPDRMIPGKAWHDFLESSRACLITPSGSSLLDPLGEFRARVADFQRHNPRATYAETAQACFPEEDGKHVFTAISPRNIEAAMSETVQIAIPNAYSGLLHENQHYLPLLEDCSNIDDVVRMLRDKKVMNDVARGCKEAVLSHDRLRANHLVNELITSAAELLTRKKRSLSQVDKGRLLLKRYRQDMASTSRKYWNKQRFQAKLRYYLKRAGVARLRHFLTR